MVMYDERAYEKYMVYAFFKALVAVQFSGANGSGTSLSIGETIRIFSILPCHDL